MFATTDLTGIGITFADVVTAHAVDGSAYGAVSIGTRAIRFTSSRPNDGQAPRPTWCRADRRTVVRWHREGRAICRP
jgi:hypothetical protein